MGGDQATTLRRMARGELRLIEERRTRVVAVTGGKGGVGKSTVAVNLAVAYARRGARVVALDGDAGMADLNLLLGLAPERSMLDVLQGAAVDDVLIEAHGIHLLPALNGSFQLANLDTASRARLLGVVDGLVERFDTLVVDTPAGIGENAVAFAGAGVDVVVVATPEPLSLADAYACLKVLSQRAQLSRVLLLPNNIRSPSEGELVVAQLRALTDRFLGVTIDALPPVPHDPQVAVAAAAGVPLIMQTPESPASRALQKAARRIDVLSQPPEDTARCVLSRWARRAAGEEE
jgi:flagellar biosynthesis protein FlhG